MAPLLNRESAAHQATQSVSAAPELRIESYGAAHETAARAFNERMRAACAPVDFLLPEDAPSAAEDLTAPVVKRQYVVLEGDIARGGVIVQEQQHWLGGEIRKLWNVQAPLSEGLTDRKYNYVALYLMKELLRRNPLIYSVGMGSESMPYPRLLKALRWQLFEVPFFFRVCNGTTFLREARVLRTNAARRVLLNIAAFTRTGGAALRAVHAGKTKRTQGGSAGSEQFNGFGTWADEIWQQAKTDYALCGVRRQDSLTSLYPTTSQRIRKLHISLGGKPVGWAVVMISPLQDHKYFGSMRLGTIVDCMAPRAYARHVIQAATRALRDFNVDLVVSNQSHVIWTAAFADSGFLRGPSNYLFAASPQLSSAAALSTNQSLVHITRGDGDGVVNL
jgi:hypothetical protein